MSGRNGFAKAKPARALRPLGIRSPAPGPMKASAIRSPGAAPRASTRFTARASSAASRSTVGAFVALLHSEFIDNAHIRTICTRVQFAANDCPKGSVYGHARAFSPLLDESLEGPVYLRSSDNKLPDVVVDLQGQVEVEIVGRVDSFKGGIRTTFEAVPDAPVSKFVVEMQGGKKGLIVNSTDLCAGKHWAKVSLSGQNGKQLNLKPVVRAVGCKGKKRKAGTGAKR